MKEKINSDELKAKYGDLKVIEIEGLTAYFRKPDLKIWRFALKAIEKSATEFKRAMAINCFVGGDKALLESPYIEDIADEIDSFITYADAEIEKDGNAYKVTVLDKSCRLRPVTIEITTNAERNNPDNIAFKTQQNMLAAMWLEGDEELKNVALLDYHMPVLRVLKDLREKHLVSIKNA